MSCWGPGPAVCPVSFREGGPNGQKPRGDKLDGLPLILGQDTPKSLPGPRGQGQGHDTGKEELSWDEMRRHRGVRGAQLAAEMLTEVPGGPSTGRAAGREPGGRASREGPGRNDFLSFFRFQIQPALFSPDPGTRALESRGPYGVMRAAERRTRGQRSTQDRSGREPLWKALRLARCALPQRPLLAGGGGRLLQASGWGEGCGCLQGWPKAGPRTGSQPPQSWEDLGDSCANPHVIAEKTGRWVKSQQRRQRMSGGSIVTPPAMLPANHPKSTRIQPTPNRSPSPAFISRPFYSAPSYNNSRTSCLPTNPLLCHPPSSSAQSPSLRRPPALPKTPNNFPHQAFCFFSLFPPPPPPPPQEMKTLISFFSFF